MTEPDPSSEAGGNPVELIVPADPAYVSVMRTVTASLAARLDFTIEEIDDLRLAVDEASALLLPHAQAGARLAARFSGSAGTLHVEVSLRANRANSASPVAARAGEIDQGSFAWTVLAALADTVTIARIDDQLALTLTKTRSARAR